MADHSAESASKGAVLSNEAYDFLKAVSLYVLPAVAALYSGLASIWGLPHVIEVVATITTVDTFIGVLLGVLKKQYLKSDSAYDGKLIVDSTDVKTTYGLEIATPLDNIEKQNAITLKVQPPA